MLVAAKVSVEVCYPINTVLVHVPKLTEYIFLKVVTTQGLIAGYFSNHVLPDMRFLNMKFGWTKYNEM